MDKNRAQRRREKKEAEAVQRIIAAAEKAERRKPRFKGKLRIEDDPWNKTGTHWGFNGLFRCDRCGRTGNQRITASKSKFPDKPADEYIHESMVNCIDKNHSCPDLIKPKSPILLPRGYA